MPNVGLLLRNALPIAALCAGFLALVPAGARAAHQTYLALGDSLAFGYNQPTFNSLAREGDPAAENPVDFDRGYVDDFGHRLQRRQPGIEIVNDGCPGETTGSFINGPCEYQLKYSLHHPYYGGPRASQLADALHYLRTHPGRVSPITLDIGANDLLDMIYTECLTGSACITARAPAVLALVSSNLRLILRRLRARAPRALMIVVGIYDPFGTQNQAIATLIGDFDATEEGQARDFSARFVNPLPVFNPPEPLESPTICRLVGICESGDIHPTYDGYEALAGLVLQQYLGA